MRSRQSEERFRTLFENAGDAILIVQEGRIIDCNARALEVFGCRTRDQILGHYSTSLLRGSSRTAGTRASFRPKRATAALAGQTTVSNGHMRDSTARYSPPK